MTQHLVATYTAFEGGTIIRRLIAEGPPEVVRASLAALPQDVLGEVTVAVYASEREAAGNRFAPLRRGIPAVDYLR